MHMTYFWHLLLLKLEYPFSKMLEFSQPRAISKFTMIRRLALHETVLALEPREMFILCDASRTYLILVYALSNQISVLSPFASQRSRCQLKAK